MREDRSQTRRLNAIVVSNRLPVCLSKTHDDFDIHQSSGGLVTALSGLSDTFGFRWLGWPGVEVDNENDQSRVSVALRDKGFSPVFLDAALAESYYNLFSNSILWRVLHYQSGVVFNEDAWKGYQYVNEIFADQASEEAADGDIIWVHDYHLMLLPRLVRERLRTKGKSCAIGFSLHTPFPARDFWKSLPPQKQLLDGILGSDVIGFHTEEYKNNFCRACVHYRGVYQAGKDKLKVNGRSIQAREFIVGIDPQRFTESMQDPAVQTRIAQLEERYIGKRIIIGVDRVDHTKGLTHKLNGFDHYLEMHPEMNNRVVLIQIAIPSREGVKEYQELGVELDKLVGQISGKYGSADGSPIVYLHQSVNFAELTALYCVADVCLLTSQRDGMNLVACEYIACQEKRHGVLALSEFTGAAEFLHPGSILFNPGNAQEIAQAIDRAIHISHDERRKNFESLQKIVHTNTSANWVASFIDVLSNKTQGNETSI